MPRPGSPSIEVFLNQDIGHKIERNIGTVLGPHSGRIGPKFEYENIRRYMGTLNTRFNTIWLVYGPKYESEPHFSPSSRSGPKNRFDHVDVCMKNCVRKLLSVLRSSALCLFCWFNETLIESSWRKGLLLQWLTNRSSGQLV